MRRKAIQKTIESNRNRLNDLETEAESIEKVVNRTLNLYRQNYAERRQMIETWRSAVKSLNMRDRTIHEMIEVSRIVCINKIANLKPFFFYSQKITKAQDSIKCKKMELTEQTEFLDQQIKNNSESEFAISQLNSRMFQVRDHLNISTDAIQLASNELISMKRQVHHETSRLQQLRQCNHQMMIDCDLKSKSNIKLRETLADLTDKINKVQNDKNSSENRLRHLDELFENEERQLHEIDFEMSRLSQMLFRSSQVLQEQHNELKLIEVFIFHF